MPRNRRLSRRSARKPQRTRQGLMPEALERRLLLTAVTGVDPAAFSQTAPTNTEISATFDQPINAATANANTFAVSGHQSGGVAGTVTTDGQTVTFDPASDLHPGEIVRVSATAGIQSTGAEANTPRVWEFRTGVSAGSGIFEANGQVLGVDNSHGLDMGDLDGDGDLDILLSNYDELQDPPGQAQRVWLNDGTGNFADSGLGFGSFNSRDVALGDVDGDGDLDYFSANYPSQPNRVWLNNGSGGFSDTGQLIGTNNSWDVELGDLDGDGDLDAYVGNGYAANRMYLNDGNGTFTDSGHVGHSGSSQELKMGDLDGDGDLDVFVATFGFGGNRVVLNDGNGVLVDSGQSLDRNFGGDQDTDVVLGDMDGDGDLDAVTSTTIWINDGTGVFASGGVSSPSANPNSDPVALGDVDGDGDLDLISSNGGNSYIALNDGNGNLTASGQTLANGGTIEVGDLDGDGDLDFYVARGNLADGAFINQNLNPSVSLAVDPASVAEAAGVATVTATLSAAHTVDVTVDLGVSGDATLTDDYTISGTQITIAAGSTSGSVTITAVQDAVDEPDEAVVVDITGATNAQEAGTQQVTVTILDDDEPIPVPEVTLTVDNAAIPEAAGVATFTATLSVATTVPVTIDFSISGTAAAEDFTASATQIVVAPGATSGTLTVTAVQDEVDEPDETVVVDIAGVTGGTESGTQQQTTTITDDDEPPVPDVTLSVDEATIAEAAGVAVFTIQLSEATTVPVTVDLGVTGTASAGDFTATATQVVIAPGSTSGTYTVTAVQDEVNEPDETVIVDITSVAGGNESGDQQATTTILDDDVPPSFVVTSLEATDSGFVVQFNNPLDGADLNLYDTQNAAMGAADVVVTGATSGAVAGSIIVGDSSVEFIKSGGPMAADTYTVTLRSATDGFEDTTAGLLDGNGDGTGGDDYSNSWTVAAAPEGARTVSIPDFVRGPGQDVNLPADGTTGIPISISDGTNVRAADIRISYDPALLEITGATAAPGGTVVVNTATPGLAILVYFSTTALPAGPADIINLQATVPTENASANYRAQQVLDVHDVVIGDGNDNEFPVVVDDAFHFATYFADVSGNGRINASDAAQVARFAALIDSGFAASLNSDPIVVGDISGNGRINAADASRVAQFAALIDVPEIPAVPGGIQIAGLVPDGRLLDEAEDEQASRAVTIEVIPQEGGFQVVDRFSSSSPQADVDSALTDLTEDEALSSELEDAIDALLPA